MIDVLLVSAMIVRLSPAIAPELRDRYAADIVAAVADSDRPVELAAALVATQSAESDWRESVETCRITGDGGAAISAFQMHAHWLGTSTRKEVCSSNAVAASLAARALTTLHKRAGSWRKAFRLYVGCSTEGDVRLRNRGKHFETLVANAARPS